MCHGRHRAAFLGSVALAIVTSGSALLAQSSSRLDLGGQLEVGGEEERYLRAAQLAGFVPLTPWGIQPFSRTQTLALRAHPGGPWRARYTGITGKERSGPTAALLRPKLRIIENSAFPFQDGGGPTWAGRGLTAEAQVGGAITWGAVSLQLAPLAFVAQNAAFPLAPNGEQGNLRFADARYPTQIDAPQRFGDRAYGRVAPGTSSLSVDAFHLVAGLSSAPQRWGPGREYPLVLGPNAGGFPMAYAGTSQPIDLWLFRVHGRVVYGELGESDYAVPVGGTRNRLGSGLVGILIPRGIPGLEIGVTRFLHRPWEDVFTARTLLRPLSGVISNNLPGSNLNQSAENQMASVFARWALPAARAEFYGEFYREDYPGAFHVAGSSLVEKPDDLASFTLGFQTVLSAGDGSMRVLRAELVNGEVSHQERDQRGFDRAIPPYTHIGAELQGHTLNGLILGSPEAYGGAGWRIGIDDFSTGGRRSVSVERALRFDWLPTVPTTGAVVHPDVIYALRGELLRFRNGRDYTLTLIPAIDLNRNLDAGQSVFNLTAELTLRGWR